MNYQGMLLNTVDISGKQSMHIDLWSGTSGTVNVALVNTANPGGTLETAFGLDIDATVGWNSFDVDLEAYGLVADGSIDQMVFSTTADAPVTDFYIDNLYFGNQTPTVGTPSAVDQPDAVHLTYETDSPDSFAPNGFEDGVASIVTDAPGTGSSAVHFFKGTDVKTWAGVTLAEEAQGVQLDHGGSPDCNAACLCGRGRNTDDDAAEGHAGQLAGRGVGRHREGGMADHGV